MISPLLASQFFTSTSNEIALFAGCAAMLGIAILSLLVFSQAREIRRLRDWAGRAPERAADMEQRVSEAAAARVQQPAQTPQTVRPVPRTEPIHARPAVAATAAATATRVAGEPQPAPPQAVTAAGTPAPPLPVAGQPATPQPATPATPQPATAAGAAAAAAPPAAATPGAEPKPIPWQQPPPGSAAPNGSPLPPAATPAAAKPAAATPAAAAPAAAAPAPAVPRAPSPPASNPAEPAPATPAPATPPATAADGPKRPPMPPAPVGPRRTPGATDAKAALAGATAAAAASGSRRGSSGLSAEERLARREEKPRTKMLLIAAGVVVILALVLVLVTKGGSNKATGTSAASGTETQVVSTGSKHKSPTKKAKSAVKAPPPAETSVTVLNGTETEGLARRYSTTLQQNGYSQAAAAFGRPPGANEATVVEYTSGHQPDAESVAHSLSVSHVQPIEQAVSALAPSAKVVVIIGTDKATTAP